MATVYLVLLTYSDNADGPRGVYARTTLESALKNIATSHELKVHISDDGSPKSHIDKLKKICDIAGFPCSVTNSERHGYGASYNLSTQYCHDDGDYFLMLEDDWELTRPLYIDPLIRSLDAGLGCIRLGYLGWTNPLFGELKKYSDMTFFEFDPDSDETHVWAGHPRLETKAFQRSIGPWPEGVDPGTTELLVAQRSEARQLVGWPLDASINASQNYATCFVHIGAVQAREDQNAKTTV